MNKTLISSLKAQLSNDIELVILAADFIDDIKELIDFPFTVLRSVDDIIPYCKKNNFKTQTRIDSDDILFTQYFLVVEHYLAKHKDEILLNFNQLWWDVENDKLFKAKAIFHNEHTSGFLTLINLKHTSHVYEYWHNIMYKYHKVITVPGHHAVYNMHPNQISKIPIDERKKLGMNKKQK